MDLAINSGLVDAVKATFGGIGVIFLFSCVALFRYFNSSSKERRERKERSYEKLDESRDKQVKRLDEELEDERRRRGEDNTRKLAEIDRLNRKLMDLESDRDRGWDLVRELVERLHAMRHQANGMLHAAFSAGGLLAKGITTMPDGSAVECPAEIRRIPSLAEMRGKRPE